MRNQSQGASLNPIDQATVDRLQSLGSDLRITSRGAGELPTAPSGLGQVPTTVSSSSPEFQSLLTELQQPGRIVGGPRGTADRQIVAEAFFADVESGVVPQLITADRSMFNNLARIANINPAKLNGLTIPRAFPQGFDVTINSRTIRVIPIETP